MKNQKGITLIALVITIIVMLILVAVTISTAMNGGLFNKAKEAREGTELARRDEERLATGEVILDGEPVTIEDIVNGSALEKRYTITLTGLNGFMIETTSVPANAELPKTKICPADECYEWDSRYMVTIDYITMGGRTLVRGEDYSTWHRDRVEVSIAIPEVTGDIVVKLKTQLYEQ